VSFWSSQTLHERLEELISPFDENRIESSSYGLSVGDEIYISPLPNTPLEKRVKKIIGNRETAPIPPGQFAYLITEEVITIPKDAIAFISIRFKAKSKGLVNVSGFHVDPGYSGKLIFAVYNAGPLNYQVEYRERLFTIWFANLDQEDNDPRQLQGYESIPTDIINSPDLVSSLPYLVERIESLEKKVDSYSTRQGILFGIAIAIAVGIFSPALKFAFGYLFPGLS
jgi:dCTP deaminase